MRLSPPISLHVAIGDALADMPHVAFAFALVFGSSARGTASKAVLARRSR